ncbi:methylene-fatty-acyl-phospholipid synthase putative [Entamoeba histolytica]|uniref:Phosphatidylethanolamine N-methyltransferase n=3 Tax=Entamoeba TaxID=5758 RepID=A0A175JDR5_ENTHI|nr:methylenefatty-acyl-phospholipid synthase, putative [Entamoeba histolytica KU27]GAT91624.1 methylene-fatty-acyl-phospholipid synthase putative [Entamoeba histolytica]
MFEFVMDQYATLSALFIFASPAVWNTLAHIEYFTHKISQLFHGNKENGFRFVMCIIISMQIIRNIFFYIACTSAVPMIPAIDSFLSSIPTLVNIVAIPIQIFGWVLSISSFYRLGFKGTYEGDCFGFLFDEMITSFPFGFVPHPMYFGGALLFISSALYYYSSTGLILSIWSIVVYCIFSYLVEQPLTILIYSNKKTQHDEKKEE